MKKIIIPFIIFSILLGSGIWILSKSNNKTPVDDIIPTPSVALPTISEDVKVELTSKNGNREVLLSISGIPKQMESIEYELTYMTGSGLPRGVLGKITLSGESEIERDNIVLGTCSSGKCVYDTGVESIDLSLKFNAIDSVSVYRKTFSL